jgi:hypothetical protein
MKPCPEQSEGTFEFAAVNALATTASDCHTHCRAFAMTNEDCDTVSNAGDIIITSKGG